MSYILDALQKSAETESHAAVTGPPPVRSSGLGLPWKIAIGAVLAANLLLLYLWRTDRAAQTSAFERNGAAPQAQVQSPGQPPDAPARPRKTLPGIASPRAAQPPVAQPPTAQPNSVASTQESSPVQAGTARVFRPRGAPITIAQPSRPNAAARVPEAEAAQPPELIEVEEKGQPAQLAIQPASPPPDPTPPRSSAQPSSGSGSGAGARAGTAPSNTQLAASRLSQLSEGAREALYVLSFSTHIYGSDIDLRAVVVNGQRLTQGNSVTAANGQEFLLLEIIDNGVIIQFEHEGATETVEIPVLEDWKDA